MNDTQNIGLAGWAAAPPLPFFDLSQPGPKSAFWRWVYDCAYDMFAAFRDQVGPDNVPGEGDGSGQMEDMASRQPMLFDFTDHARELVSDSETAWQEGIAACDKAIFDFLQTVEAMEEEEDD